MLERVAAKKTNAARQLDKLKLRYELREYVVDESDLSAPTVAAKVGMDVQRVFKTLLCRAEPGGELMAVIPGDAELDLKKLARASGNKKAALVALKEVQPLTGYIRGGVTALAAKRAFPVVLHESALGFDSICVSAGQRGLQIVLAPKDYVSATRADVADIVAAEAAA